jgi:hypothetical protein
LSITVNAVASAEVTTRRLPGKVRPQPSSHAKNPVGSAPGIVTHWLHSSFAAGVGSTALTVRTTEFGSSSTGSASAPSLVHASEAHSVLLRTAKTVLPSLSLKAQWIG